MTINKPDTFDIGNSEKYILSIRLRSGGLSFSGYNRLESGSFFCKEIAFERNGLSYADNLKEFFFENDLLLLPYKKIYVIIVSPQYTLIPQGMFQDKLAGGFLDFNFSCPESKAVSNTVASCDLSVVFGVDEVLYEFCARSLLNLSFVHHIMPLLTYWKKQSILSSTRQMYVNIHDKIVDIACFLHGDVLFANTFSFEHLNDILYYILYVWKQLGMDQLTDRLQVSGSSELKNQVMETLRNYVQHTAQTETPSEVYLWGVEAVQAPIDLITLLLCE